MGEYVGSLGSLTSGKAVLGSATVSKDFPPLVPCDDAGDPIPSEVYVQRGTGRWQRCKCQVHGYLLMVQLLGRSTGAVRMTMFVDLLEAQAHCGGMMLVHECGKLVAGVEHKRCAVTLHDERIRPESRTLERAQSSRIVADLQTSSLQKSIIMEELRFEMGQATYPSESEFQKLARGFSGVFRDEDTETVLNCEESDRSRFRSVGTQDLSMVPSGRPESTIESDVDDSFIAEKREGDVSDPSPQESPFDRLVKLELDMTEQIVECTALLSGVEADCQALLDFFAPNVPSTESAVSAGLRIVNSMAEFKSQLEKAWDTVSEHQRKSEAGSKGARGRRGKGRGKKAEREPDETFHDAVESLES